MEYSSNGLGHPFANTVEGRTVGTHFCWAGFVPLPRKQKGKEKKKTNG
jgi:hypothetical protein